MRSWPGGELSILRVVRRAAFGEEMPREGP